MNDSISNYEEQISEIDAYIYERRYSQHGFVKNISEGRFSQAGLKNWAIQKYHQTYMQNCMFSAIHSNAIEYEDIRQFTMMQLIAEETQIMDGSDSHYNLMKHFAKALGAKEEEFKNTPPGKNVIDYINYMISLCRNMHPVYGMLAVYTIESQSAESVNKMLQRIKNQFPLDEDALEWFIVHGELEEDHASGGKKLILKHASELVDFVDTSWKVVKNTLDVWKNLQNYYMAIITAS